MQESKKKRKKVYISDYAIAYIYLSQWKLKPYKVTINLVCLEE